MAIANIEGKCYCFGKGGHKSPVCRMKDKVLKDKWAINKANFSEQLHINAEQPKNTTAPSTASSSSETRGWSGAQTRYQFYQSIEMKDVILLGNGSTVNLFCNPKLVENIRTSNETLTLSTNRRELFTNQCTTVPIFGEVWYDPSALTNIFSLALLKKKHRITFD
jgi:hypothetical protein